MDFGLHLGTRGAAGSPDGMAALARHAEKLGYAYLGFSDHVVFTRASSSQYPYSPDGKHPVIGTGFCLEQLSCLTYVAAITERIRLLTSVMVGPHRPAILAAKTLGTVDVLSKGRLTVGLGVGWLAEEIAALSGPPYEKRGAASNELIRAFRELWTQDDPRLDGEFVTLKDLVFEPKPIQKPHPPIWVGGEGTAARRRAARLGDGWYPTIRNPNVPLGTPEAFSAAVADVRKLAQEAGRSADALDIGMFAPGLDLKRAQSGSDGRRISFTGSREAVAEDARAFFAAGARHIVVSFESADLQDSLDRIQAFAEDVMPLAGR